MSLLLEAVALWALLVGGCMALMFVFCHESGERVGRALKSAAEITAFVAKLAAVLVTMLAILTMLGGGK